jgi:thiamine transport system permease protein
MYTAAAPGLAPPRFVRCGLFAVPLAFLGVFFVWPTLALLWRGLNQAVGDGENVLAVGRTWEAVGTTFVLAIAGTVASVAIGLPAAWALFRVRWKGQAFTRALVSVPFVLPTVVVATAFTALLRRGGILGFLGADQSVPAIVAALAFFNVAVVVRVVGGTWAGLDPDDAIAARTLGASPWKAFRYVTAPNLVPSIAAAASIVFLFCASSFGVVLVLGGTRVSTIETEIWVQVNQFLDLRAAATLALLQMTTVALALVAAGWARSRRERTLGRRRVDGTRLATRRDARFIFAALAPVAFLFALPLAALLQRALRTRDGWGFGNFEALVHPLSRSTLPVSIAEAVANSLSAATIAAAFAAVLGLALAHSLTRAPRARWLDSAIMLPVGVSSVIVGLGILLTLNRPLPGGLSLGNPSILIPAAQAVVALPLVVRSLVPTLRGIGPGLRASAATLGASPWQVWRRIDWPLVRGPFGLALGLAFAISLGEFGATSFLARPDYPTLPTAIVRLLSHPGIESAGLAFAASVVLAVLTGAIMMIAERLRSGTEAEI